MLAPVVNGDGAFRQVGSQFVRVLAQLAGDVLQVFQLPVEAHQADGCRQEVCQQKPAQNRQQDPAYRGGDPGENFVGEGGDIADDQRAGNAPQDTKL